MNRIFHILNGDCLAEQLKETSAESEVIICREALISGDLQADSLDDFWKVRALFISKEYDKENYYEKSVYEFQKILDIPESSEVNLWFEDDLFCQTNLWFCIFLLPKNRNIKVYRVFPKISDNNDYWKGFSVLEGDDLKDALQAKVQMDEKDIEKGVNLWNAYENHDNNSLLQLSKNESICYPFLKEVVQAYFDTFPENQSFTNPEFFIKSLIKYCNPEFKIVFKEFQKNFGILGYGDSQVRKIYDRVLQL